MLCFASRGRNGGLSIVIFTLLHMATTTDSTKMHNIHWNASNPIFKTDNVIEINRGNHPWEYDQVNIVCPVYKPGTSESSQERYIIYSVTKEEYQACRITQPSPKIIAVCNRPYDLMYFTITFRSFTPTPGGLEFRPGNDYFFISTSSRNDLHRRVGGGCTSNNMKVIFRVAEDLKVNSIGTEDTDGDEDVESASWVPREWSATDKVESAPYHYPIEEISRAEKSRIGNVDLAKISFHNKDNKNLSREASHLQSSAKGRLMCLDTLLVSLLTSFFVRIVL